MMIKKVIDVDLRELDQMSLSLGRKIKADGFIPDHILYVERAGLLIGTFWPGISRLTSVISHASVWEPLPSQV